jgi:hypothetical protein
VWGYTTTDGRKRTASVNWESPNDTYYIEQHERLHERMNLESQFIPFLEVGSISLSAITAMPSTDYQELMQNAILTSNDFYRDNPTGTLLVLKSLADDMGSLLRILLIVKLFGTLHEQGVLMHLSRSVNTVGKT